MTTPYDGTEDLLKTYYPADGFKDAKSIIMGIDKIEKRDRNKYLSDTDMARITDDGTIKLAIIKRIFVFQIFLNFIDDLRWGSCQLTPRFRRSRTTTRP
jgi:hypothetical protein